MLTKIAEIIRRNLTRERTTKNDIIISIPTFGNMANKN